MTLLLITLQWVLLLPALPLMVLSLRTSRAQRSRHRSYLVGAAAVALLSLLLGLLALGSWGSDAVPDRDIPLWFIPPPVLTLVACGWVMRRALVALDGTPQRGRRAPAAR